MLKFMAGLSIFILSTVKWLLNINNLAKSMTSSRFGLSLIQFVTVMLLLELSILIGNQCLDGLRIILQCLRLTGTNPCIQQLLDQKDDH